MELVVDPPNGVGPILIGMPFSQAQEALRFIDGFIPSDPGKKVVTAIAYYESEMSIGLEQDRNRNVRSVEVYRPSREFDVVFRGFSIFGRTATEVIRELSKSTRVEIEDEGLRVVAPDLLISLWRAVLPEDECDEDGRYFESVLVALPGYYE